LETKVPWLKWETKVKEKIKENPNEPMVVGSLDLTTKLEENPGKLPRKKSWEFGNG